MTNTKICPQCGEVNAVTNAACPKCGRQFKTTAPLNNQQNDPKTVIGSFSPSFGQQSGYNQQPNFGQQSGGYNQQGSFQNEQSSYQQPAFGQMPNNNQQNFNPLNYNQPPKSSKAVWWILGGVLSLVLVGFMGLVMIGVLAAAADGGQHLEGTKWRSETGSTVIFGKNKRYTEISQDGSNRANGDLNMYRNNQIVIQMDGTTGQSSYRWSIDGNRLTLIDNLTKGVSVFTSLN